jgi:hypothetical protein
LPKNQGQDYQPDGENSLAILQVNSHGKKDSQSQTCNSPIKGEYQRIADEHLNFGGKMPTECITLYLVDLKSIAKAGGAKAMVSNFAKIDVTNPVCGVAP